MKWHFLFLVYLCGLFFFWENVEARQSQVVIPSLKAGKSLKLEIGDSPKHFAKKIGNLVFKGDSIEIDSAKINQYVIGELEKEVYSFVPEDFKNAGPEGELFQNMNFGSISELEQLNFSQSDFKLPKEKLQEAQLTLQAEKKKYETMLDTRIKELARRRNSLRNFQFYDRIELGGFINLTNNNARNLEIYPQIGYALSKKSIVGTGSIFSLDDDPTLLGIFGFFSREVFKNIDWISEYHIYFKRSDLENLFQSVNKVPFRSGFGSDIKILGKIYLRSGILFPVGINSLENARDFKKNISAKIGLVYKRIK